MPSIEHLLYRSMIRRDRDALRDLQPRMREMTGPPILGQMAEEILFRLAVRRFGPEPPLAAIREFLLVPRESPRPRAVSMIDAEAALRGVLGEPGITRGMTPTEKMDAASVLMVYLNDELALDEADLDDLIAKADKYFRDPSHHGHWRL